jgi:2-polyprenyl-3-methyl-5-hydroxy-6-metoxy-1,4-benzoquinol methylase
MAANVDETRLQEFVGRFAGDLGAALHQTTVIIGDRLGLYAAMGDGAPVTPAEVADRTQTDERYVREWLCAQAASGYVEYDADTEHFHLTPEQAACLADRESPTFLPGAFYIAAACLKDEPALTDRFRTGEGFGWHEHDHDLFCGTELFFRPGYVANLVPSWLPALDGVQDKLLRGARVADIGCGHGASTIVMAQAYPQSEFFGSDYHAPSIKAAREAAQRAGVSDRVHFEVAGAKAFTRQGYDLVCVFDALHDMGDPVGAAAHVRQALAPDGTWLIVEPMAGDHVEENLNPVGRIFYSASTLICTPASRSQEVGLALGAQAGEARLRDIVTQAGFTRFRRATETPFNLVLEARP